MNKLVLIVSRCTVDLPSLERLEGEWQQLNAGVGV